MEVTLAVMVTIIAGVEAITDSPTNYGCAQVQSVSSVVVRLCQLNATLSCSNNRAVALRACIPAIIVISVVVGVVLLVVLICIVALLVRHWKRKVIFLENKSAEDNGSKSSEETVEMSRSLLECHLENRLPKSTPIPITLHQAYTHNSYKPPQADKTAPASHSSGHRLNSNTHRRLSTSQMSKSRNAQVRNEGLMELSEMSEVETSIDETSQERDKETAVALSQRIFHYKSFKPLPNIGSRLMKHWYMIQTKQQEERLQFTVRLSKKCQLKLKDANTVDLLKTLFKDLKHSHLLVLHDFAYDNGYISIVQAYVRKGSIRDLIYNATPVDDWSKKYFIDGACRSLTKSEIAKCCQQVLEAAEILFDIGFPYIGQIHSGNVFVLDNDQCVLGGYENTLLGYRSSCFQTIKQAGLMDKIDVVMFGHLIYEMCTNCLLINHRVLPTDFDYENIDDSELLEVTQHVFKTVEKKKSNQKLVKEIASHPFFKKPESDRMKASQVQGSLKLTADVVGLINQVFFTNSSDSTDTNSNELHFDDIVQKLNGKYEQLTPLPKLGWRFNKIWAKGRSNVLKTDGLLTVVVVPDTCPIYVEANLRTIKQLLVLEHDHIHNIRDIHHMIINGQHVIVNFQDLAQEGSLKDLIHKHLPTTPRESKCIGKGKRMKREQIATFGGQILNAMSYLSHLDGRLNPLVLGHVHTGNIFVENNVCRLGGFENVLLGYQTRQYNLLEDHRSQIDVIMFGHVLFEMSTGKELMTAVPTEKDYRDVPNDTQPVLKYIFEDDSAEIDKVMEHPYFAPACIFKEEGVEKVMETDAVLLLEKVRKGKPRNQDDQKGKRKYAIQANISKATSKLHKQLKNTT